MDAAITRELNVDFRPLPCRLWSYRYKTSLGAIYLERANQAFLTALQDMIDSGCIDPITPHDRVFESGCNVGAVLRQIRDRYGCAVSGLDISENAIKFMRESVFSPDEGAECFTGDVRNTAFFERFVDNTFSHTFCVAHLVHVPNGPDKTRTIEELKRISRNVVLFERIHSASDASINRLHYTDYVRDHGFTEFRVLTKPHPHYEKRISICYFTKP